MNWLHLFCECIGAFAVGWILAGYYAWKKRLDLLTEQAQLVTSLLQAHKERLAMHSERLFALEVRKP